MKIPVHQELRKDTDIMQLAIAPQPVVSLVAGILIFLFPKLINNLAASCREME